MQKNRKSLSAFLAAALALAAAALFLAACDVDSVDSVTATPSDGTSPFSIINFSGLYAHSISNSLVPLVFPTNRQSGAKLTWLRLLQYGSVLEAYDNAGLNWSGSISGIQSATATFSLQGRTTAGQPVDITGTMVSDSTNSTMEASWIEPTFAGTIFATAIIAPAATNNPSTDLSLTSQYASLSIGNSTILTASGCSSSYTWECAETYGTLSENNSTATYTRTSGTSTNNETITVKCGDKSKSVTIEFN